MLWFKKDAEHENHSMHTAPDGRSIPSVNLLEEGSEKVQGKGYLNCFFCSNVFPNLSKDVPEDVRLNLF